MTAEILIAALMLTAPPDAPQPAEWAMVLRPNILALALADEVLDPRECGWTMGTDPLGDLAMLQNRWLVFASAPKFEDADRFPDRKFAIDRCAVNRAARLRMANLAATNTVWTEEVAERIAEIDREYQVWDSIRDSQCPYYYVTVRRESLRTLRDLIGPEDFYAGRVGVVP